MFHTRSLNVNRGGRPTRFRTFFGIVGQPTKEPLKRSIFFAIIAGLLITTGTILTYIGFSDISSKRLSTVGPLLIGLSLLLFLFSVRHFLLYRKIQQSASEDCQLGRSSVAAMVIERDAEGTVTVVMDMINPESESIGRSDQAEVDIVRPPTYNEVIESSIGEEGFPEPEGDPPPTYDEALEDTYNESQTNMQQYDTNHDEDSTSQTWNSRHQCSYPDVTG